MHEYIEDKKEEAVEAFKLFLIVDDWLRSRRPQELSIKARPDGKYDVTMNHIELGVDV